MTTNTVSAHYNDPGDAERVSLRVNHPDWGARSRGEVWVTITHPAGAAAGDDLYLYLPPALARELHRKLGEALVEIGYHRERTTRHEARMKLGLQPIGYYGWGDRDAERFEPDLEDTP